MNLFAQKLVLLRQQAQWTQQQCATELGLAQQSSLSKLEQGLRVPSLMLVVTIANTFHISLNSLLHDDQLLEPYPSLRTIDAFPERLLYYRMRHHLTQQHLATILDMSQWHMSHLETGSKRPSITFVLRLSTLLHTPIDAFFTNE